jgi:histidine phosphotransferase ChpT
MTEVHPDSAREESPLGHLIAARICHDIVSPLGAIANGVELLGLTTGSTPEMKLIAESVENATARIRFFRLAYGPASPDQLVSRSEVVGTLAAVAKGGRMTFDWQVQGECARLDVRAVFLLLQCMEASMPLGGHVTVSREGGTLLVEGESNRIQANDSLWSSLRMAEPRPTASAALVQFALLPDALAQAGRRLRIDMEPGRIIARL